MKKQSDRHEVRYLDAMQQRIDALREFTDPGSPAAGKLAELEFLVHQLEDEECADWIVEVNGKLAGWSAYVGRDRTARG